MSFKSLVISWLSTNVFIGVFAIMLNYEELPPQVDRGSQTHSFSPDDIKVIAFDNFGTVYDFSEVPRDEVREYIRQVRRDEWAPLDLPASWEDVKAFPDSAEGIAKLRERFMVVTCANGSLGMLARMAKKNGIQWDAIVPLEIVKAYKPDPKTYQLVADAFGVRPDQVLIVTGNEGSPDITEPRKLGMHTTQIRTDAGPKTVTELAKLLGCD